MARKKWFEPEPDHKKCTMRTKQIVEGLFDLPNVKRCLEMTKNQWIECGTPLFEKNGKIVDGKLFVGTKRKVRIGIPKSAIGAFHTHPTNNLSRIIIGTDWQKLIWLPLKCVGGAIGGNYVIRCMRSVKCAKGRGGVVSNVLVQIPFGKGAKPVKSLERR